MRSPRIAVSLVVQCLLLAALCVFFPGCSGDDDLDPATVVGRIFDDSTLVPLQGARLQVEDSNSAPAGTDGVATLAGVSSGLRTVTVFREGYQARQVDVELFPGVNNLPDTYLSVTRLTDKAHVTGTVRSVAGAVAGAQVTAGGKTAFTRADGTFIIHNIEPGEVAVSAVSGALSGRTTVTIAPNETVNVDVNLSAMPPPPPVI